MGRLPAPPGDAPLIRRSFQLLDRGSRRAPDDCWGPDLVHQPAQQHPEVRAALRRFETDPRDPLLRARKLKGELSDDWAFSVDDDLQVLFRWDGEVCFLVAVGTHDEIY